LPSETKCENPIPRAFAQSSVAVQNPPDCDTNASVPALISVCANVAFSPMPGTSIPTQFGPSSRSVCGRAASSIAWLIDFPSRYSSDSPAVMTAAAFVPRSPSCATTSGIVRGGVQITARSGATGRLATFGYVKTPATAGYFGFTGMIGPVKLPCSRLRMITPPTLTGLFDAPTTATDCGLKRYSR
jgi:hypothetical protein